MSAPRTDLRDHRDDPDAWALALGISVEAVQIWLAAEPIDLHTDTLLWHRLLRWNPARRHRPWFRGSNSPFLNQVDFPRAWEARYAGIVWDLPTNPLRRPAGRRRALLRNLETTRRLFAENADLVHYCRDLADYRLAREAGKVASWIGLQGATVAAASWTCSTRSRPGCCASPSCT